MANYILPLILVLLKACVDPIPYEADQGDSHVVIFGTVTQESWEHKVTVSSTRKFKLAPLPVSDAAVNVVDDQGKRYGYLERDPGEYYLDPSIFQAEVGHAYFLEVTMPNGKVIRSEPEVLKVPVEIKDISFNVLYRDQVVGAGGIVNSPFIDILISTSLVREDGQPYLRWVTDEAYSFMDVQCHPLDGYETCYFYLPESLEKPVIFHSEDPGMKSLVDFKVFSRQPFPTIQFNFKHYFNVRQYNISREAYEYWEKVRNVANPTGSIFDVPPAGVRGNLYFKDYPDELVLGYFEVAGASIARTFTQPWLMDPVTIIPECMPFAWSNDPDVCCFCYNLPGATQDRPDYW